MIRRPPRSTLDRSSAASDVYKRQITNGVHVPTWLAPQMSKLYDRHLGPGWMERSGESELWERIEDVDDGELWETHLSLKSLLLEFVRRSAVKKAERRKESPE